MVAAICSVAFDANAWTIATMPLKYGGLGLCLPTNVALSAYLASTAISKVFVNLMFSTDSYLQMDANVHTGTAPFSQSQASLLFSPSGMQHLSGRAMGTLMANVAAVRCNSLWQCDNNFICLAK